MDCHNRPAHAYQLPERAVDQAMYADSISSTLPFARKTSIALIKQNFATSAEAETQIPAAFAEYYRKSYPAVYSQRTADVTRSAQGVLAVYNRNIFPEMKVTWGLYPNNIGHMDSPGCFRCHDELHVANTKKTITQDCSVCHQMVAVDEASPEILKTLGIADRMGALK